MIRIGIDFSLNSPAVTVETEKEIRFFSFFNVDNYEWDRPNPLKKFKMHNEISSYVCMKPYSRQKNSQWTYAEEQSAKMSDAEFISKYIINTLDEYLTSDTIVSLEGFAFASSGSSFIDLILFNSFLRKDLIDKIGSEHVEIVAPASAKKLAGKGNADKEYMVNAFLNDVLNDNKLTNTDFYKYLSSIEIDFKNIKPIDDIVDSYFIMKSQKK